MGRKELLTSAGEVKWMNCVVCLGGPPGPEADFRELALSPLPPFPSPTGICPIPRTYSCRGRLLPKPTFAAVYETVTFRSWPGAEEIILAACVVPTAAGGE